jgi:glycosyltransferase involved in cell wall biosynthesis
VIEPMPTDTPAQPRHRVLMIAYEFPPLAAGGVARTVRFARYLPRFGWQPHILTTSNPAEPARDKTLLGQIPDCARLHRTRSWEYHVPRELLLRVAAAFGGEPGRWREGLTWRLRKLYDPLAIPDHKIFWAAPAILRGVAAVLWHKIGAIYSTSWPYSDHVAGMAISALTGRPFIADLRDPWTQHMNYRAEPRGWDRMQRRLERRVCSQARFVVAPARRSTRAMRRLLADLPPEKFVTIRNGYDPADFVAPVERLPRFEIVHAGTLYKSRQPDTFVEGLAKFLDRVPQARAHTRARFFGMSLDSDLSRFANIPCFEMHGWTAHEEVVGAMRRSSVLFLLRHSEKRREITVPWKIYEYMATGNHVLSVQVPQYELDRLMRAYGNATILRRYEAGAIAEALEHLYRRWHKGELSARTPPPFVQRFSGVELTRQLATLLNRAVGADALERPRPQRREHPVSPSEPVPLSPPVSCETVAEPVELLC